MTKFAHNDTKIVLGDFNAKVDWERKYRLTIGLDSLHDKSNENGEKAINFAASWGLRV